MNQADGNTGLHHIHQLLSRSARSEVKPNGFADYQWLVAVGILAQGLLWVESCQSWPAAIDHSFLSWRTAIVCGRRCRIHKFDGRQLLSLIATSRFF